MMRGEGHSGNGIASRSGADGVTGSRESRRMDCVRAGRENSGRTDCVRAGRESRRTDCVRTGRESGRPDCSRADRENGRTDCSRTGRESSRRTDCSRTGNESSERYARRRRAMLRQRRLRRRRRFIVCLWTVCLILAGVLFLEKRGEKADAQEKRSVQMVDIKAEQVALNLPEEKEIQGLPESVYEAHPEWEENFLTPNEYSRPGEALEEVKNIFVHYTANPGTSAAQNRSYFEQQKDMHQASVSAHFIIGYEGEIIQCLPLDEIGYAVQTRNYDSISIECCYKAKDGSFTRETYDSLIELLAWLTDAYELDTEKILRHYDCGGKKCPLYYTEHPDAWKKLKKDVEDFANATEGK